MWLAQCLGVRIDRHAPALEVVEVERHEVLGHRLAEIQAVAIDADHADRLSQRFGVAHRLDEVVHALATGVVHHGLEGLLPGLDWHVHAEVLRDGEARVVVVGGDHGLRAGALQAPGEKQARRALAHDHHGLAHHIVGQLAQRIDRGAELLRHEEFRQRDVGLWHLHHVARLYDLPVAECTRAVLVTRHCQNQVALRITFNKAVLDIADAFMAGCAGIGDASGQRNVGVHGMHIAAADRGPRALDQDFALDGIEPIHLLTHDVMLADDVACAHFHACSSWRFFYRNASAVILAPGSAPGAAPACRGMQVPDVLESPCGRNTGRRMEGPQCHCKPGKC